MGPIWQSQTGRVWERVGFSPTIRGGRACVRGALCELEHLKSLIEFC